LRETERPRLSVQHIYFRALKELRAEARLAHTQAIEAGADFEKVARIWLEIQLAFAGLYLAWFLPRRTGLGMSICQRSTTRLNEALWKTVPIRATA